MQRWGMPLLLVAAMAGCGGGGGGGIGGEEKKETLIIGVSYASNAYLFRQSSIVPVLTGFNGHKPHCELTSGTLPAGMSMSSNCSINGTPTNAGSFGFTVRVTAENADGYLIYSASFDVIGPAKDYVFGGDTLGTAIDLMPAPTTWSALPSEVVHYTVTEGVLPTGLSLDPATGRLSGVLAAQGEFDFSIGVSVSDGSRSAALAPWRAFTHVYRPELRYDFGTSTATSATAWLGFPFQLQPILPVVPGATFSFGTDTVYKLPAGLSVDPVTGVISGMVLQSSVTGGYADVVLSMQSHGVSYTGAYTFNIDVASPVLARIGVNCHAGQSCSGAPVLSFQGPYSLASASYSFAAVDPLPFGMSIDPTTGVISGTPNSVGYHAPKVDMTVGLGDRSFVVTFNTDIVVQP